MVTQIWKNVTNAQSSILEISEQELLKKFMII